MWLVQEQLEQFPELDLYFLSGRESSSCMCFGLKLLATAMLTGIRNFPYSLNMQMEANCDSDFIRLHEKNLTTM